LNAWPDLHRFLIVLLSWHMLVFADKMGGLVCHFILGGMPEVFGHPLLPFDRKRKCPLLNFNDTLKVWKNDKLKVIILRTF